MVIVRDTKHRLIDVTNNVIDLQVPLFTKDLLLFQPKQVKNLNVMLFGMPGCGKVSGCRISWVIWCFVLIFCPSLASSTRCCRHVSVVEFSVPLQSVVEVAM